MPTYYTKGPARVHIRERRGGGHGGGGVAWLVLLVIVAAMASRYLRTAEHAADQVARIVLDVAIIAGSVVGLAALVFLAIFVVRLARGWRAGRPARARRDVQSITDARWSYQASQVQPGASSPAIGAPQAWADPSEEADEAARTAWARVTRSQGWPGIPREWTDPEGSWPDESQQWGQR
jgi:hypothetical protein